MSNTLNKTVALTGATGFLGSYLIDQLIDAGFHVRALTRRAQTNRDGLTWIMGDVQLPESLDLLAEGASIFIHAAGLVKALSLDDFRAVNKMGSWNALQAAKHSKISKFIMVSSMAAREPTLSHYSRSKWEGDNALLSFKWPFEWMIIRPGGIYGPGDHEFLPMFSLAKGKKIITAGGKNNRFGLIHASDMAKLIVQQLSEPFTQEIIEADDGTPNGHSAFELETIFSELFSHQSMSIINTPKFALKFLGYINSLRAFITRRPQFITHKKANELTHTDWTVHSPAPYKFKANYDLKAGFQETLDWYKENKLI